ncbi:MAG: hypothetical protein Q4G16_11660 [Cruoricaptor ignavus]|nr:hypothetical protein [Cruoricaptor ignavus]
MIKKISFTAITLFYTFAFSQETKSVGINNSKPEATLDIAHKSTATTPVFRIGSTTTNSNHLLRVMNTGFLVLGNGNANSQFPLTIYPANNTHADFAVVDGDNPNLFLKHYHIMTGEELTNYGVKFNDRSGHAFVFSSGGLDSGLFLGANTDVASGLYIGENGKNGIGVTTKPTETLDIGGNLRIGTQATTALTENGTCNNLGEIAYNGSFWGCTSKGWKKIDN